MSTDSLSLADLSARIADVVHAAGASVLGLEGGGHTRSAVAWTDALAVTVAAGLDPDTALVALLPDGTEAPATLVGVDPRLDLAVVRVEGLTPAARVDGAALRPGDLALTLGRTARGLTTTLGVVSSIGPAWTTGGGADVARYLGVDAGLPPVSAGGALLDAAGRVVGVNTPGLVAGGTTVPADTVDAAVAFIEENGSVRPGLLGVRVRTVPVPPDIGAAEGVHKALQVIGLPGGGPAARAGIETGDVLLSVDGQPLGSLSDLRAALSTRGGHAVQVRRLRAGVVDTVEVTPTAHRGGPGGHGRGPWRRFFGQFGHGQGHGQGHGGGHCGGHGEHGHCGHGDHGDHGHGSGRGPGRHGGGRGRHHRRRC